MKVLQINGEVMVAQVVVLNCGKSAPIWSLSWGGQETGLCEVCLEELANDYLITMNDSYGEKRIYGFLAERYLSFWFKNYANHITWPVYFKDID